MEHISKTSVSGSSSFTSPLSPYPQAARERDPNCIDNMLRQIEVELSESLNSASNLSDKLIGKPRKGEAGCDGPPASQDISSRLVRIINTVHSLNQELGTAHGAISG